MNRKAAGTAAARVAGLFFTATAIGNAFGTLRIATGFLEWLRDGAWLPPFRSVLKRLVPAAPAVVLGTAAFQAVIAFMLLTGKGVQTALRLAQLFVLGLIPCIAWPYWVVNVGLAAAFEAVRRACLPRRPAAVPAADKLAAAGSPAS
ncbi:hypothetical protein [Arthrobacter koreensis]|uniref:hypothetical protein n=1 Tax=Arthrobacter koreensis TaxID=199136 RepID=UPI002DB6272E|nr:hypothetical protein [Arthrobacter koreensis]MEB7505466.1 hypothetical protein [Arthrobacter koreensis]